MAPYEKTAPLGYEKTFSSLSVEVGETRPGDGLCYAVRGGDNGFEMSAPADYPVRPDDYVRNLPTRPLSRPPIDASPPTALGREWRPV